MFKNIWRRPAMLPGLQTRRHDRAEADCPFPAKSGEDQIREHISNHGKLQFSYACIILTFYKNQQCPFGDLSMTHPSMPEISRLIYTNAGNAILALVANGGLLLWKWSQNETNSSGKVTTKVAPQLWQPRGGLQMTSDLTCSNFDEVLPCFALSKNDCYVISASGAAVSLFNMMTLKKMKTFMAPPPAARCIAFYPSDNNIIAVGMDDSTILIFNVRMDEVKSILEGHHDRITGLAFSNLVNALVSCGADAEIVVWDSICWEKKKSRMLDISTEWFPSKLSETHVQFHHDQTLFLVVHETRLAIYEAEKLQRVNEWIVGDFRAQICHATFSCDSQLIFASFLDGTVLVFSASDLHTRCEINPSAYLPADISFNAYPLVIAAHPKEPNQFALGLMDGGVVVIEPLESESKWYAATS
ncbi:unnamed protein product [Ilex paraguariensis]|uniref:Uncharacterized protein n=1 Tax=Ilex paraguariensis TaxID=185542 RepID=A0ABC8V5T2_9AQUA